MVIAGQKVPESFSPQDILNNTYIGRRGCMGGQTITALQWIVKNGICKETDCPYKGKKPSRAPPKSKERYFIKGWRVIPDDEQKIEEALEKQPVMISIPDVTGVRTYTEGLLDLNRAVQLHVATNGSEPEEEHTVLLVGRGHIVLERWPNIEVKFWFIKNQWSGKWGREGFGDIIYTSSLIELKRLLHMDESDSDWFYSPLVPLTEEHHVDRVNKSLTPMDLEKEVVEKPNITVLVLLYKKDHIDKNPELLEEFRLVSAMYEYDMHITFARINLAEHSDAADILKARLSRTKPVLLYFPSQESGERNLQSGLKFPETTDLVFDEMLLWLAKITPAKHKITNICNKEKPEVLAHEANEAVSEPANRRRNLNVVFISHVGAGKSTIGGQILFLSGQVDECTIQKYEKKAKDKAKENWIMDTNEEEHAKGKTVEVGRAYFETETTRFTILDAPGHKSDVPNLITGASQADIGVLVISARKGEFETVLEKGGRTQEDVMLAKTLGVTKLLVVVNKMDDPTVNWSKERYDEIESKMIPFLESSHYNVNKDVQFLPISGLHGTNIKVVNKSVCAWWGGPSLFEAMDVIEGPVRDPDGPLRLPITNKFRDMGTVVMGKIESGSISDGESLIIMPNEAHVKVTAIHIDDKIKNKVKYAVAGENIRVRLSGISAEDVLPGFVLSSISKPVAAVNEFNVQLHFLELDENEIFTAGYNAILHIHSVAEKCWIVDLLEEIDPETKKPMKKKPPSVKSGAVVLCRIRVNKLICVEKFSDFPQLGRFTLCREGKTVAVGEIIDLFDA